MIILLVPVIYAPTMHTVALICCTAQVVLLVSAASAVQRAQCTHYGMCVPRKVIGINGHEEHFRDYYIPDRTVKGTVLAY